MSAEQWFEDELWFVNRWYDEEGVPHYFGIIAGDYQTIEEAQAGVHFNVIDTPVDLVYGPCSLDECDEFMADVQVSFKGGAEGGSYEPRSGDD